MTTKVISNGRIFDNVDKCECMYTVTHGRNLRKATMCQSEWNEIFSQYVSKINCIANSDEEFEELLTEYFIGDLRWNWVQKSFEMDSDEYEWFFCDINDRTQGACVIFHPKKSYLSNGHVFYIEYIATAPWNRKIKGNTQRFRGIGTILIQNSVDIAITELGLNPGFNLHSLPQSCSYYEKIGMLRIDSLKKGKLDFFEMPEQKAMGLNYGY